MNMLKGKKTGKRDPQLKFVRMASGPLFFLVFGVVFSSLLGLVGCQSQAAVPYTEPPDDYPNNRLLVTTDWLADRLEDPGLRVIDMREEDEYRMGHIPEAVNVAVGDITSTIDGIPFEYDHQKVLETLNRIGLEPEMTVVIYDDLGMMSSGRLFWTLEYVGHEDVRVLHGGWNAWVADSQAITDEIPEINAGDYPIQIQPELLVNAEGVLARLDDPGVVLVDARSPQEYTGEVKLAARGGHIPGAVNLQWRQALTGGDTVDTTQRNWQVELQDSDIEYFKSLGELQALLNELEIISSKQVITYCQTHWRAAHVFFLLRLMGFEDVRAYDGSWVEWGEDPELPVVSGTEPDEQ
jgi:thiosulfate/3-mercaptopyruvate sulfurtransferase